MGAILFERSLGKSLWQNTPVTQDLLHRLPITFELGLMALIVALSIAIPIGVYSAMRQDSGGDYVARSFSILMLAVPSFWIGTMVMVFPSLWWGWSPPIQFTPFSVDPLKNLSQMITPAIILGFGLSALTMRLTRTMMLEVLRQDYIRTAWAKGLGEKLVVLRHALRNALIPVVTLIGLQIGFLLGGSVVTETMFAWPGVGRMAVGAITSSDFPLAQGAILILAVGFMVVNLVVDTLYAWLDPRIGSK